MASTKTLNAANLEALGAPSLAGLLMRLAAGDPAVKRALLALGNARSARYKHAARHLQHCAALARHVTDFAGAPDHLAYVKDLRDTHGRKTGFWGNK